MIIRTILAIFLLLYTGCLCHPVHISQSTPQNASENNNEKKGTIRISGPWHSDSALDRNIDAGEDSYVKKIISSNEGINFNKDMAEAGEMFDVNGIEDFYDKNAVVTYEVNGHEIPVHLKQKYTPQTKIMFPEYSRDSPPTLGAMTKSPAPSRKGKRCVKALPCLEPKQDLQPKPGDKKLLPLRILRHRHSNQQEENHDHGRATSVKNKLDTSEVSKDILSTIFDLSKKGPYKLSGGHGRSVAGKNKDKKEHLIENRSTTLSDKYYNVHNGADEVSSEASDDARHPAEDIADIVEHSSSPTYYGSMNRDGGQSQLLSSEGSHGIEKEHKEGIKVFDQSNNLIPANEKDETSFFNIKDPNQLVNAIVNNRFEEDALALPMDDDKSPADENTRHAYGEGSNLNPLDTEDSKPRAQEKLPSTDNMAERSNKPSSDDISWSDVGLESIGDSRTDDEDRKKAKAKILSLLGLLADKLKGVVTDENKDTAEKTEVEQNSGKIDFTSPKSNECLNLAPRAVPQNAQASFIGPENSDIALAPRNTESSFRNALSTMHSVIESDDGDSLIKERTVRDLLACVDSIPRLIPEPSGDVTPPPLYHDFPHADLNDDDLRHSSDELPHTDADFSHNDGIGMTSSNVVSGTRRGVHPESSRSHSPSSAEEDRHEQSESKGVQEEERASEKKAYSSDGKGEGSNEQSEHYIRGSEGSSFPDQKSMPRIPPGATDAENEEQIQKFKDQDKPFIMNTAAIDYKPKEDDDENENDTSLANITPDFNLNDDLGTSEKESAKFHHKSDNDDRNINAKDNTLHMSQQEERNIDDSYADTKANRKSDENSLQEPLRHKHGYQTDHRESDGIKENDLNPERKTNNRYNEEDSGPLRGEAHAALKKNVNGETKAYHKYHIYNDDNTNEETHENTNSEGNRYHNGDEQDSKGTHETKAHVIHGTDAHAETKEYHKKDEDENTAAHDDETQAKYMKNDNADLKEHNIHNDDEGGMTTGEEEARSSHTKTVNADTKEYRDKDEEDYQSTHGGKVDAPSKTNNNAEANEYHNSGEESSKVMGEEGARVHHRKDIDADRKGFHYHFDENRKDEEARGSLGKDSDDEGNKRNREDNKGQRENEAHVTDAETNQYHNNDEQDNKATREAEDHTTQGKGVNAGAREHHYKNEDDKKAMHEEESEPSSRKVIHAEIKVHYTKKGDSKISRDEGAHETTGMEDNAGVESNESEQQVRRHHNVNVNMKDDSRQGTPGGQQSHEAVKTDNGDAKLNEKDAKSDSKDLEDDSSHWETADARRTELNGGDSESKLNDAKDEKSESDDSSHWETEDAHKTDLNSGDTENKLINGGKYERSESDAHSHKNGYPSADIPPQAPEDMPTPGIDEGDHESKLNDNRDEKDGSGTHIPKSAYLNKDSTHHAPEQLQKQNNDEQNGETKTHDNRDVEDSRGTHLQKNSHPSDGTPHQMPDETRKPNSEDTNPGFKSSDSNKEKGWSTAHYHNAAYVGDDSFRQAPEEGGKLKVDKTFPDIKLNGNDNGDDKSATHHQTKLDSSEDSSDRAPEEGRKAKDDRMNPDIKSNEDNDGEDKSTAHHQKNLDESSDSSHRASDEGRKQNVDKTKPDATLSENSDREDKSAAYHQKSHDENEDSSHREPGEGRKPKADTTTSGIRLKPNNDGDDKGTTAHHQKDPDESEDSSHRAHEEGGKPNIDKTNSEVKSNEDNDGDSKGTAHHQKDLDESDDSSRPASEEERRKPKVDKTKPDATLTENIDEDDKSATHHHKNSDESGDSHREPEDSRNVKVDRTYPENQSNDKNDENGGSDAHRKKNAYPSEDSSPGESEEGRKLHVDNKKTDNKRKDNNVNKVTHPERNTNPDEEAPNPRPGQQSGNVEERNHETNSDDNNNRDGKADMRDQKKVEEKENMLPGSERETKFRNSLESMGDQINQNEDKGIQSRIPEKVVKQREIERGEGIGKDKQRFTESLDGSDEYIPVEPAPPQEQESKGIVKLSKNLKLEDALPLTGRERARKLLEGLIGEKPDNYLKANNSVDHEQAVYHHSDEHGNLHGDRRHEDNADQEKDQDSHHDSNDGHLEHNDDQRVQPETHELHDSSDEEKQNREDSESSKQLSEEHHKSFGGDTVSKATGRNDVTISSRHEIGTGVRTFTPKTAHGENVEYPDYNEVKDAAVFETNLFRKNYRGSQLTWSEKLSDKAQQVADKVGKNFINDNGQQLEEYKRPGQNVALVKLDAANVGKDAVDAWTKEAKDYDFKSPLITKRNSDFVQLAWKNEKEFGMGVSKSKAGNGWVVVSMYDSPYVDRYQELTSNVQPDKVVADPYEDISG